MKKKDAEGAKAPQNHEEFIARFAPLFAAHPGELAMKIARDDDDGFRGGPGMGSPWGDSHRGGVRNSEYCLAVIDPAGTIGPKKGGMSLTLPVGKALLVHLHGTHTLTDHELDVGIFDIDKMGKMLVDLEMACKSNLPTLLLPEIEFAIGDAEVVKVLAMVHTNRELVAIRAAAAKLGHPITGCEIIDKSVALGIQGDINWLHNWLSGCLNNVGAREVAHTLAKLAELGVDKDQALDRLAALWRARAQERLAKF